MHGKPGSVSTIEEAMQGIDLWLLTFKWLREGI
jgi:hypothetical protein